MLTKQQNQILNGVLKGMLIDHLTNQMFNQLKENCLQTEEDLAHLNAFPYNGMEADRASLLEFLKNPDSRYRVWLIEENEGIVGFLNFGNFIPWQPNSFGVVIGKKFTKNGYARKALLEFIERRSEFKVLEINGYCNQRNTAIINLMETIGFKKDLDFRDRYDAQAIKYSCHF